MAETDRISGLIGTLGIKAPVRAATTANVTLSGEQTIDGVALILGDRVLVKDQTAASENGIYYVELGAWTRAPDFDGPRDVAKGTMVCAGEGTANANVIYRVTTTGEIVFGSTAITFAASAFGGDIAARIHDAANKVTPVGADEFGIWDNVSGALNRLSITNLVAYLSGLCSAGWNAATATLAAACSGNAATATTAGSSGTFTITGTGFVVNPTATATWRLNNGVVTLHIPLNAITGTSNSTGFTLTGLPAAIQPVSTQRAQLIEVTDATSIYEAGMATINGAVITLNIAAGINNFTASGTKSLITTVISWPLD